KPCGPTAVSISRALGRLKGRPLSLTRMYLERDEHATGLIRLLSVGVRVLTLLEFVVRRRLATERTGLAGLASGNPRRATRRAPAAPPPGHVSRLPPTTAPGRRPP